MNGYELRDLDDGTVELVEIKPTVIAIFRDRDHAERYFGVLSRREEPAARVPDAASATVAIKVAAVAQTAEPTDEEWVQAFQAIQNGDEMKKIAGLLGVEFNRLRGKYAAWTRLQNRLRDLPAPRPFDPVPVVTRQPATTIVPIATGDPDAENCRLCDRLFRAGDATDGLCSRCRHEMERQS
ncbi:hypothetical protein JYP51_09525 [Ponticoccus gilvus]|nr:hypothetical protein [Enemella evansiae]